MQTAATGLISVQKSIDISAHNLANAGTGGYKKEFPILATTLYQHLRAAGTQTGEGGTQYPLGLDLGNGVQLVGVGRNFQQGAPNMTENPTDLSIVGEGFFQIQNPDGSISYTRQGQFQLDGNGNLVNHLGYQVLNTVTIPNEVMGMTISKTGQVTGTQSGEAAPVILGQIELARFPNPQGLKPIGDGLYAATEGSGAPSVGSPGDIGMGKLEQYTYEASNVEAIKETTDLVRYQNIYRMLTSLFDIKKKNDEAVLQAVRV